MKHRKHFIRSSLIQDNILPKNFWLGTYRGGRNPWLRGLSCGHDIMRGRYIVEATAGNSSPRSYQPIIKRRCAREALPPSPLLPPCLTDLFFPSLGLDWTPNFSRRRLYTSPWVVSAVLRPARKCAPRRPPAH